MARALILSASAQSVEFFREMLKMNLCAAVTVVSSSEEARSELSSGDYELVIVNSPVHGEDCVTFALEAARLDCQIIFVVREEHFDEISAIVEKEGVFTVSKPVNRNLFWGALRMCSAALNKNRKIQDENRRLRDKIEDIRIIDRAKWLLIDYLKMSEAQAHRYIEKQAMDMRLTRRQVAENILKTYER